MTLVRGRKLAGVTLAFAVVCALAPAGIAHAASTDVVINELVYNPVSDVDGDEFLELYNAGPTAVDISGWCFNKGIDLCFATGTTMASHGFLVVSPDAARTKLTYGVTPAAVYAGGLKNSGETVTLVDASKATIDSVTYKDTAPWPVTPDGLGPSLELIDPTLDNSNPWNWSASTNMSGSTPGRANSVAGSGLGPEITQPTATPRQPAAGQSVTVSTTIANANTVRVYYKADFAAEQSMPMADQGGGAYSATMPGVAAGHLLRYRIQATNAVRASSWPRVDDTMIYEGVVAANNITSAIPVLEWFISDSDYNDITSHPTVDIEHTAVLAYDGNVIDNAVVNIRGAASQTVPKPNWKFSLPQGHDLMIPGHLIEPVDEFGMQADFSDKSHGRPLLSWEAYQIAGVAQKVTTPGVVNNQVFPVRTQKNGQFLGLYTYMDLFDNTWRSREGYDESQFFKSETGAFSANRAISTRFEKKNPSDNDFAPLQSFLNGVALTGTARRNYLLANADIPELINYAAVTAIIEHVDSSSKNFYLSQDPVTMRWSIVPWDLDHTWGNGCCKVNSSFVTPAEPGDKTNDLMAALLAEPDWKQMYFRRLKTLTSEILAPGRLEAVYDARVGPAAATAALDFPAWPSGSTSYAGQRTSLFNAINARRTVFNNDSRLPGQPSAAPTVVVNEIQDSPAGGSTGGFVELYNPSSSEAVDLSGWNVTGAVTATIPAGTVILPKSTMTLVANDSTFRATYGSTIFVSGSYSGDLPSSGTVGLARADGSIADTVNYGGSGWPAVSGGKSLELLNPSADNNDPTNWARSIAAGGTPGAANQSGGGGGGGDSTPPQTIVTSPASGASLAAGSVTLSGTASDNVDVAGVSVSLQNTSNGTWLQPGGTFAATQAAVATSLVNDLGTSTGWQLATSLVAGNYTLSATAVDATGNADASPATRSFAVGTQQGPDTVAPNTSITSPVNNQSLTNRVVVLTGLSTDNQAVARVQVALLNVSTKKWLRSNGTFGSWMYLEATLVGSGTSAQWTYTTPSLAPGTYRVNAISIDAVGLKDASKASVTFTVK